MPTADTLIANATNYADSAIIDGNTFIAQLNALMVEADYVVEDLPTPTYLDRFSSSVNSIILPSRPTVSFTSPVAVLPTAPEISLSPIEDGDVVVPDFDENPPALNFPDAPTSTLPTLPPEPTVRDPDYPDSPTLTFPSAPELVNPELPVAPVVTIPDFTSELPIDDLVVPTNTFEFAEVAYASSLLDAAQAKLLSDLENGSYGIDTNDEEALWERARTRENDAAQQQIDEIAQQAASRGFPLPPGDMLVSMDRARTSLLNKLSQINSEIMSKKADLFVENRRFTLDQVRQYETMTINYHNAVMERALNAERARVEVSIAVYNTLVARFNARLQAHQVAAQVFESRVRAEIAKVDIYRGQLEGAKLQADLQRLAVENYTAQLGAINSLVNIYRTQLEAAQIKANVERTRIEVFSAQINAYAAQVQAKVAQFNMYTSQVGAERAKIDAYQSKVNAYTSRVQASQVKSEIALSRLRAEVEQANAEVGVYRARIEGYAADLRGQVEDIQARLSKYQADANLYQVDYTFLLEGMKLNAQMASLESTEKLENAKIAIANAREKFNAWEKVRELRIAAAQSAGAYYGARANAALNGINALVSQST